MRPFSYYVANTVLRRQSPQLQTKMAMHPVQILLSRPAKVTCLSAIGNNGAAAKCNINGASVKPPSESVPATDRIYFYCEGAAPLKCTAEVAK